VRPHRFFLEDMAVDTLRRSSFGTGVMTLCQGLFPAPSGRTCTALACGWAWATDRHTITPSVWLTGATAVTHVARFEVFRGGPLYDRRWQLWGALSRLAVQCVPAGEVLRVSCDETPKTTAGRHSEGRDRDRHGAGSARQADRTVRGWPVVWGGRHMPRTRWPGHRLRLPVGLALSLKPARAPTLPRPARARSPLARARRDVLAEQVPGRPRRRLAAGGEATKDSGRQVPKTVQVLGRFPIRAQLHPWPPPPITQQRGAPRNNGALMGSPHPWAQRSKGWAPHPAEAGAEGQAWGGRWHAGLPGRLIRVVVVRRDAPRGRQKPGPRTPPPPGAAVFTTELSLSAQDLLPQDGERWAVAMALRDANAGEGVGQDQCRTRPRLLGANTCRCVRAAARPRWFLDQVERGTGVTLCRDRPWDRQQVAPSHLAVVWACREALHEAGIVPIPRLSPDLAANHEEPEHALPLAA
jgi:hypothetical protein